MRFPEAFLEDIRQQLPIATLIGEYVVWDKKKTRARAGDFWGCCPFHGEKSPSFHADNRRGHYKCFGCGVSGDVFKFLTESQHMTFPQAVERCASLAGIPMPQQIRNESPAERAERETRDAETRERIARDREQKEQKEAERRAGRTEDAFGSWQGTVPLIGTLGEAYLTVTRGIAPIAEWPWDPVDTIRFHPSLDYELDLSLGRFPAVVCKVVDAFGDFLAIWQVYLDARAPVKAKIANNKVGRGPARGGAIRIGGDAPEIEANEGFESALGAWELHGYRRPSWSMMSTSMLMAWEPPVFVKKVRTNPDGDKASIDKKSGEVRQPPGMLAALTLRERLVAVGIENPINETTMDADSLDLLVAMKRHDGRLPRID